MASRRFNATAPCVDRGSRCAGWGDATRGVAMGTIPCPDDLRRGSKPPGERRADGQEEVLGFTKRRSLVWRSGWKATGDHEVQSSRKLGGHQPEPLAKHSLDPVSARRIAASSADAEPQSTEWQPIRGGMDDTPASISPGAARVRALKVLASTHVVAGPKAGCAAPAQGDSKAFW